jgi:WD repeat-containing protein 21A
MVQGLAVDYSNGFIYAAGQDCRIRGWALDSGEPILPSLAPEPSTTLPNDREPLMPVFTSGLLPPNYINLNSPMTASGQSDTSSSISPWKCYNPFLSQFPDYIPVLRVTSDADNHSSSSSGVRDTGQDSVQELASYRRNQDLLELTRKTPATCLWAASRTDLWKWDLGQRHVTATGFS